MSRAGAITKYKWTQDGDDYFLFSKPGRASEFVNDLEDIGEEDVEPVTRSVDGFSRRAYPGGPPISVKSHSRTTMPGGSPNKRTLPGSNVYFEEREGIGSDAEVKVTTATITGPFTAFYEYVKAKAKKDFVLRSPDGTPYEINGGLL